MLNKNIEELLKSDPSLAAIYTQLINDAEWMGSSNKAKQEQLDSLLESVYRLGIDKLASTMNLLFNLENEYN